MNLKILAFPLLIFLIIFFSIWFVHPAYLELSVTQDELKKASDKLGNIEQKIQTAERLSGEVANNQEYQRILTSLLPAEKSEEQIVNEMNNLIFTQGMVVYGISFSSAKSDPLEVPVPVLDETGNVLTDPITGQPVYSEAIPQIKNVEARVGAIGDYDKIKSLLRKLVSLKRANNIAALKISKEQPVSSAGNQENASNGILKMDITVDFAYLEKVTNAINVDDGIFTSGQFNLSGLDEIWKTKNTIIPELRTDPQGASNPFVL